MSDDTTKTLVVVGGGITGLVAARTAATLVPEARVMLLERDDRVGGKILTQRVAGVPVEAGADWFLTRQPAALDLCRELGLNDLLVEPGRTGAYIWSRGKLRKIPPSLVRGVPTTPLPAFRAGLVSSRGAMRALWDLIAPGPLEGADISIGSLVRRRFGSEVLARLVDPLLAASRSGNADELSLAAAAPEVDAAARSRRSVMLGLRGAMLGTSSDNFPPFLGLRGGMEALIEALRDDMRGSEIRTGVEVAVLERHNRGYLVRTGRDDIEADAVIAALPAFAASQLVRTMDESLARELQNIVYSPAVVVTLVYPPGTGSPPPEGSGLLVPSGEGKLLTACAWFSEKWEHARPEDGSLVLRCFVARPKADGLTDDHLIDAISEELRAALHLSGPPIQGLVTRWDAALPVYRVGHLELVERIEQLVQRMPGLELAGAGYRGSGLPDCISQGQRAAEAVAAHLRK